MFSRFTSFLTGGNPDTPKPEIVPEPYMTLEDGEDSSETTEEDPVEIEQVPSVPMPVMPMMPMMNETVQRRLQQLKEMKEVNELLEDLELQTQKALEEYAARAAAEDEDSLPELISDEEEEEADPVAVDLKTPLLRKVGGKTYGVCDYTGETLPAAEFDEFVGDEHCSEACGCDDCLAEIPSEEWSWSEDDDNDEVLCEDCGSPLQVDDDGDILCCEQCEYVDRRLTCKECGQRFLIKDGTLICPQCDSENNCSSEEEWLCGECGNSLHAEEGAWFCESCGSVWVHDEGDPVNGNYPYEKVTFTDNPAFSEDEVEVEVVIQVEDEDEDEDYISSEISVSSEVEEDWESEREESDQDESIASLTENISDLDETNDEEDLDDDDEVIDGPDPGINYEERIEKLLEEMWNDANRTAANAIEAANRSCNEAGEIANRVVRNVMSSISFPRSFQFDYPDELEVTDIYIEPNPFEQPSIDTDIVWRSFEEPSWSTCSFRFNWPEEEEEELPTTDEINWPPTNSLFDDIIVRQHSSVVLEPSLDSLIGLCDEALSNAAYRLEKFKMD